MAAQHPILVAGCGNAMAGDDAFGPAVIEALRREAIAGIEAVDLGMDPLSLIDHLLEPRVALMLVDAACCAEMEAGTLLERDWDGAQPPEVLVAASSHGLSLVHQVELAQTLGLLPPRVRLLLVMLDHAQVGHPLSAAVARQVPVAVQRIRRFAQETMTAGWPVDQPGG